MGNLWKRLRPFVRQCTQTRSLGREKVFEALLLLQFSMMPD